jgi:membrane protein DedA with SNARE-associated domain
LKLGSLALAALVVVALACLRRRLSRVQLGIGVVVVAWLAVRGAGVVELPDLEDTAKEIGPTLGAWTYVLVALMAFLETAFFVGLIAPGEFSVVLGGFVAGQGEIDVFALGGIVFVCAAAGDTTSFFLGRALGRQFLLRHGRSFGIDERRLGQVERFFQSHGNKTIVIGRFLGLVRALAPFVAGASNVPRRRFLPIDYVAAALWSATFVSLGYVFWQSFDAVVSIAKTGALALGGLVFAIVLGIAGFRWLESAANRRRLRRAWRARSLEPLRQKA